LDMYFARDERAIMETQRKYANFLYTIASNIVNAEDAEECVNDTYYRAWETIPPKRPAFFRGFLGKIVRNCSLDKYRSSRAKKRGGNQMDLLLGELTDVVNFRGDVHEEVEEKMVIRSIEEFLMGLDEENRFMFMRRYWYADSITAISQGCRASEAKVKSALYRTRHKLREHLEREGLI